VYREWIKTYNGGIKKIRKIMKRNGGRIPEKGKEYWEKYEEWRKKVDPGKITRIQGRRWRKKKELLNKEEEYLKEQVYSYGIRNTHLKKQNRIYNYFKPTQ
jgi:hypothetical protein